MIEPPECPSCQSLCWATYVDSVTTPCTGRTLFVTEMFPGDYTHWCESHEPDEDQPTRQIPHRTGEEEEN